MLGIVDSHHLGLLDAGLSHLNVGLVDRPDRLIANLTQRVLE